jgi:site-specific recombinase XerD
MFSTQVNQRTLEDYLLVWIDAFLVDRKAQNVSRATLEFYRTKLKLFTDYCEGQQVKQVSQINPSLIREFLLSLEATGHNSGGIHAVHRSVRAFLKSWENEVEPDNWKNLISKVKPPMSIWSLWSL